jgi:hydroxypyruvate isomerase
MRYSACIEMLYPDLPFAQRITAAKQDGFAAVEFWSYPDKDLSSLSKICRENEIPIAACCVGSKDASKEKRFGEIGLIHADSPDLFAEMLKESAEIAVQYEIPNLIVCSGNTDPLQSHEASASYLLQSLVDAAEVLKGSKVTLLLEPLNLSDHPGTFLTRSEEAYSLLQTVQCDQVKLLFDLYHQQMTEGNLTAHFRKMMPYIGHFHLADVPGRQDPGTGELNWKFLLNAIEHAGYTGYAGLEYFPSRAPSETLAFLTHLQKED